ncbi:MAG: HPF/RaiA family ribosome-associated protein [Rhodocyclaceae bacterium]
MARRIDAALGRFGHTIQEASVRLCDINGPERGGVDKLCRVVLRFRDDSILVIEELGSEVSRVIDRAADRLHQSVSRQVCRKGKIDRRSIRQGNLLAASG